MEWTAEAIDQLRAYWAEGHSTAEIGRRMGISKNAVVGKAHRLNLDARPSPIRREAEAGERPAAQPPPGGGGGPGPPPPAPPRRPPPPAREAVAIRRLEQPAAAPAAVVRPFQRISTRTCCWPLGEPGTPEFRFCSGEALTSKP